MGEIERALQGTTPFGMQFIRSNCTRVSTDVFQIVKHLNALSPDRYKVLFERFKEIQRQPQPACPSAGQGAPGDPAGHPLEGRRQSAADLTGPKMANLAELARQLNLTIPDGFVVTSAGFELPS
jgi:pyruvate, water dikinase